MAEFLLSAAASFFISQESLFYKIKNVLHGMYCGNKEKHCKNDPPRFYNRVIKNMI